MGRYYLWVASLPMQYAINALLDKQYSKQAKLLGVYSALRRRPP